MRQRRVLCRGGVSGQNVCRNRLVLGPRAFAVAEFGENRRHRTAHVQPLRSDHFLDRGIAGEAIDRTVEFDVERDQWGKTKVVGRDTPDGPLIRRTSPKSWSIGFAPAVEYNWSPRSGAIFGVWIVPKGHNTRSSVTPAIAIQRFW